MSCAPTNASYIARGECFNCVWEFRCLYHLAVGFVSSIEWHQRAIFAVVFPQTDFVLIPVNTSVSVPPRLGHSFHRSLAGTTATDFLRNWRH